ncbi:MAG: ribosomal protein S18-alanine N-acetyltransferase [Pseudomonadales bacterium]
MNSGDANDQSQQLSEKAASLAAPLVFRQMLPQDIEQVLLVESRSYAFPWSQGNFLDCMSAGHQCWVALSDDVIIGHGIVTVAVGEAHLLNVCVLRELQGRGYGREFLNHLLGVAFSAGARRMFLEVRPSNYSAVALYQSLGFAEIGVRKDYYPSQVGHEDALVFALDLGQHFVGRTL